MIGGTPNVQERLRNKIELLESLKERGIWLIDSSIIGLYRPNARRPANNIVRDVILESWNMYVKELLCRAEPDHVIVIGCYVYSLLKDSLKKIMGKEITPVCQPQKRMKSDKKIKYFKDFHSVCSGYV